MTESLTITVNIDVDWESREVLTKLDGEPNRGLTEAVVDAVDGVLRPAYFSDKQVNFETGYIVVRGEWS